MGEIKKGKFCHHCNRQVLHTAKTANHLMHLILSVVTFGCWIPIWSWAALFHGAWTCSACGSVYNRARARRARRQ